MGDTSGASQIRARARALLERGEAGTLEARGTGRVERPVPILHPDGRLHSWFVPVTVGDRLVGFVEMLPDSTLLRYSSFQRHQGSVEGCPTAASWIDPATIRRRAERDARPGETVGEPRLTYDSTPARLAWAAILASPEGGRRTLYIAGDTTWEASGTGDPEDTIGGP